MPPSSPSALIDAYLEKRAMLVRYFSSRTRDVGKAEEIVQELYLKIARLNPDYASDNPAAFLFRAGTNIMLNQVRTHSRANSRDRQWLGSQAELIGDESIAEAPSAEATVSAKQQLQIALAALEDLPERTQQIFRLHRFENLTQAEVAQRLEISKSSVEKHMHAALKHMLSRLGP